MYIIIYKIKIPMINLPDDIQHNIYSYVDLYEVDRKKVFTELNRMNIKNFYKLMGKYVFDYIETWHLNSEFVNDFDYKVSLINDLPNIFEEIKSYLDNFNMIKPYTYEDDINTDITFEWHLRNPYYDDEMINHVNKDIYSLVSNCCYNDTINKYFKIAEIEIYNMLFDNENNTTD